MVGFLIKKPYLLGFFLTLRCTSLKNPNKPRGNPLWKPQNFFNVLDLRTMSYTVLHLEKAKGNDSRMSAHIERTIHPKMQMLHEVIFNKEMIAYPDGIKTDFCNTA